jgi:hypothetical protein
MKKHLLLLTSLMILSTGGYAKSDNDGPVEMPAYYVTAQRRTEAEKAIDAGLAELKESAKSFPLMLTGRAPAESNLAGKHQDRSGGAAAKAPVAYRVAIKA